MREWLRLSTGDAIPGAHRRRGVVLLGVLATLLFTQLLSQQSVVAEDDYLLIEARIVAERQGDGSVSVWLEVRRSDDGWDEWVSPRTACCRPTPSSISGTTPDRSPSPA